MERDPGGENRIEACQSRLLKRKLSRGKRKAGGERSTHGERQRAGDRVRWKSIGWPHWGHRILGRAWVGSVSGWVSAEGVEAVN